MSSSNMTEDEQEQEAWQSSWYRIGGKLAMASADESPDRFLGLLKEHRVGLPGGIPVDFGPDPGDADNSTVSPNTLLFEISSNKTSSGIVMAKALIDLGADMNVMSRDGQRPLMAASGCKAVDMVRLLLESGADVHARESATSEGEKSVIGSFLLSVPSPEDFQILDELIKHGASLKDLGTGETALMMSIQMNSPDRLRFFLSHGEDPHEPIETADPISPSALEYANLTGYTELGAIMQAWLDAQAASQAIGAIIACAPGVKEAAKPSP